MRFAIRPRQAAMVLTVGVLGPIAIEIAGIARTAAASSDDEEYYYGVLVDMPGVDVTYAYCAGCHSERIIAQQGLTREGWEELLDWMVEEQGMGEIDEPDYSVIIDYLSDHYGEDRPNFPS